MLERAVSRFASLKPIPFGLEEIPVDTVLETRAIHEGIVCPECTTPAKF